MQQWINRLKQPFPCEYDLTYKVRMAAFFGVFVFLFLLVFKPFELDEFGTSHLAFISGIYGLITFGCVLFCSSLAPILFPRVFTDTRWTTGKQILFTAFIIFTVGLVNYILSPLFVNTELTWRDAFWFQGITLAVSIFPVSLFVLSRQRQLSKRFSTEALVIEKELQEKLAEHPALEEVPTVLSNKITLLGDYQDEKLDLYLDDIYLVTSASNYIKIYHLQKEKLVYSILRSTLKKAEDALLPYPAFFRCHRAYIVNLEKVEHVAGNAQGYKVKIREHDTVIPVSRNLSNSFSDVLLAYKPHLHDSQ